MGGLNRGAVGQPDTKTIVHRLLVVARVVEFEALAGAAGGFHHLSHNKKQGVHKERV